MSKSNNNSNIEKKTPKRRVTWEEKTAEALKQWSMLPDSFAVEDFYTSVDIPAGTFYGGVNRNNKLKEAHEFALTRIGVNREKLAIERNLSNNHFVVHEIPNYLPRVKKNIEWRSNLKNLENQTSAEVLTKVLEETLKKMPETDKVPKKVKE